MELSSVKSDAVSLLSITSETSSLSKHMVNGDNGSFAAKTLTRAKKKNNSASYVPMLTRRRKMAPFFLLVGEVAATCRLLFDPVEGTFARLY